MGASEFIVSGDNLETKSSWGIRLGYVAAYELTESFFLKGAILINQRGFNYSDERWGLNAVDLPLNLGFSAPIGEKGMKWFLDAGINIEYNFRAFTKVNDELVTLSIGNETGDIKPFSFGVNGGTGIQFTERMQLRFSYYYGLTNLLQTSEDSWKNFVIGTALIFHFQKNQASPIVY